MNGCIMPGFKQVNGFLWPQEDFDCAAVVFTRLVDLDVALRHVGAFNVAIQAGGNAGVWPKSLGKRFKAVYTWEPEADNFHCLAYNCLESHIFKFQAALGYERKGVSLAYESGRRNMGAVYVNGGGSIPVMRIDDLALPSCDLIQLDLEGYEPEAIGGALETIRRCHPVIMVEDKGLSERYGRYQGWPEKVLGPLGYRVADRVERDVILVHGGGD